MFAGALVLNVFAAIWCGVGLLSLGRAAWFVALPVLVSLALIALAWRASRHVPPRSEAEEKRAGRLVGIWSAFEGVAFFLAINLLRNLHRQDLVAPVLAVIVGVHFVPLARGLPVPVYYFTGSALMAIGLAGLFLPAGEMMPVVCLASGLVLWASSAVISARALALRARPS